jgi:hypothetical protein
MNWQVPVFKYSFVMFFVFCVSFLLFLEAIGARDEMTAMVSVTLLLIQVK